MPHSSCEPCCDPSGNSRLLTQYRSSVLQILCAIAEGVGGIVEDVVQNTVTLTTSVAETTLLAAGAAGEYHDLSLIIATNTSATPLVLSFRDATAGTVRFAVSLAANSSKELPFNPKWKQTTAASAWTVQSSASVTSVIVSVQAVTRE